MKLFSTLMFVVLLGSSEVMSVDEDVANPPRRGTVSLTGLTACPGDTLCYLYGNSPSRLVMFSSAELPSEDRLRLRRCGLLTNRCVVTITGTVMPNALSNIVATAIEWGNSPET